VLEPALGPNSVITLDDEPHMQQRKLLLPPFHGERVRRYGELIRDVTRREMESWPVGRPFALRPRTQKITLAVILRAVFGIEDERRIDRAARLIDVFSDRVTLITKFPTCAGTSGPSAPGGGFCGPGPSWTSSSTRRSPCAAPRPMARATTCSRCC
jgi:cytochrome P450